MLALIKNEFLYAKLGRQWLFISLLLMLFGVFAYPHYFRPRLALLQEMQDRQHIMQLKQEQINERLGTDFSKFQGLSLIDLQHLAEDHEVALKILSKTQDHVKITLAGDYQTLFNFLQAIICLEAMCGIESMTIEKQRKITAVLALRCLEIKDEA